MVATRSRSAALPVLTFAAPIVGLNAVVVVAAVVLARPGEPPARPIQPPAVAARGVVAPPPAGRSAEVKPPDPPAATAESPPPAAPPAPTVPTPPGDDIVDDDVEPVPAPPTGGRPAVARAAPRWTPEELQASLLRVPEVWLQHPSVPTVPKTGRATGDSHPLLSVVAARPDLRG